MRLIIDTDVFCKLAISDLLSDALSVLGVASNECGRLPALPHMLRRGKLPKTYGEKSCAGIISVAKSMEVIPEGDASWLDRLTPVQDIDAGEAQLFSSAAQNHLLLMTGDKRALRALKNITGYAEALAGRIVVLEAILLALCDRLGSIEVRRRLSPVTATDKALMVCFSTGNLDPRDGLESNYRSLAAEVQPLALWIPRNGGKT